MPSFVPTSADTLEDQRLYTSARLVEVACLDCLARVGVKKNSDHHTSIQWTAEARSHCPLRIILVGAGVAEIDEYSVADEPGYPAVISSNDARAGGAVGPDHFPHILGIETRRERGRADQIAKHNGEVAPLGVLRRGRRCDQRGWIEVGNSTQHFAAMA